MLGYLVWVIVVAVLWVIGFTYKPKLRKKILWSSLIATPMGLGQIYFFKDYWTPETLFNLGLNYGLDIESFLLMFFLGGLAAFAYEGVLNEKMPKVKKRRDDTILKASASPIWFMGSLLVLLRVFPEISVVHNFTIASLIGGSIAFITYPNLRKHIILGGITFGVIYWLSLSISNLIISDWIAQTWLASEISGITLFSVPIEEIFFGFAFGTFWSSIYEEMTIRTNRK